MTLFFLGTVIHVAFTYPLTHLRNYTLILLLLSCLTHLPTHHPHRYSPDQPFTKSSLSSSPRILFPIYSYSQLPIRSLTHIYPPVTLSTYTNYPLNQSIPLSTFPYVTCPFVNLPKSTYLSHYPPTHLITHHSTSLLMPTHLSRSLQLAHQ